ncbi:unnamed protein product [Spirodela intermedia]|uniref:DEP domain-containing protein n=1 Tax=Spirodela intermedia TaxID=51605 RepID=A0A7I8JTB0_SPIIN|nr:unnamed protein product [Spirodela intermedia]CAA6673416.1 unnamed protein product [Spirodela intermedia]
MVSSGKEGDREVVPVLVPPANDEHGKLPPADSPAEGGAEEEDPSDDGLKVAGEVSWGSDEISREEDSDGGTPASWSEESDSSGVESMIHPEEKLLCPPAHLPQPEKPLGISTIMSRSGELFRPMERSLSDGSGGGSAIGKYLRNRGSVLSAALAKSISSLKESDSVSEFHLSGLKVTVRPKKRRRTRGTRRSSVGSASSPDPTAVTARPSAPSSGEGAPLRGDQHRRVSGEEEGADRAHGSASVPQIFFNEKLVGGLVALNSLRNSGEFDRRLRDMAGWKCPETAPRVPLYGFDDADEEEEEKDRQDAMIGIVKVLRHRLPIQDRLSKMKLVKNCFSGGDLVETVIDHLDCGRKRAVDIGKELCRKHFIHHVSREKEFEDGYHLYRLLEHDPDSEPKSAVAVGRHLTKLMWAILEAYASDDRRYLDYGRISASEEFRRYVNLVEDLQRVDLSVLSVDESMAFFLNLYNAMVIHAVIKLGRPEGVIDRRAFFGDFYYMVGGFPYSLTVIKNGILRSNRRQPYSLVKPFNAEDKRLQLMLPKVNPLIHFGLCNGTRSSPTVRFFSGQGTEMELRNAAREFFHRGGLEVDLDKRTVRLTRIVKWYSADFGDEKEILKWVISYLDSTKAGLLTHLQRDGGPVHILYQDFDWSSNS